LNKRTGVKIKHILNSIKVYIKSVVQKILMTLNLFMKNELPNHAGASAFFFLLSVVPVLLLLLLVFEQVLAFYPNFSDKFFNMLSGFNSAITREVLLEIGLLNVKSAAVSIIVILSMIWFARMILLAILRGIGIIFPADKPRTPVMQNLIALAALPVLILFITLIVLIGIGLDVSATLALNRLSNSVFVGGLLVLAGKILPYAVILLLIFAAYRLIPVDRPRTIPALTGSLFCTLGILAIQFIFSRFLDVARFNLIYGILGSLILTLVAVYAIFTLFFLFAEYVYVSNRFDVLMLERMFFFRQLKSKGGKIGKYLFKRPYNLFKKYARKFQPGDILFQEGDKGEEIYFTYHGKIGIYLKTDGIKKRIAAVNEGEIFGEMAYLLKEKRTATAIVETESTLFVITPAIFEGLLKVNRTVSQNVIELLCDRLQERHKDTIL
jgi:membrane protein